jgi:hypothetical protein
VSVETANADNPQGPRERRRALDLDERRTALHVGVWARATVSELQRASLPPRMSRGIINSLEGLNVDELGQRSRASTATIIRLIANVFGGRIDGVRSVRSACWFFPRHFPPAEYLRESAGAGGGPKRRFG